VSPPQSVFIAYPMTAAKDLSATERLVRQFRAGFLSRKWTVRPRRGESVEAIDARMRAGGGASLVSSNIEGIGLSDLLLVVATEMEEPSSVWVEVGVAMARGIPLVVVAEPSVRLPFLVRAAVTSGASAAGSNPNRLIVMPFPLERPEENVGSPAIDDIINSIVTDS
jgi:hypothetical protein